jgi:hypothetical protein
MALGEPPGGLKVGEEKELEAVSQAVTRAVSNCTVGVRVNTSNLGPQNTD